MSEGGTVKGGGGGGGGEGRGGGGGQRNMSYKQKVYDIKQKLVSEGFTNCDEVVEKLNLSYDDNQQIQAGQYHLKKILRQYRKKYKDKKLKEMCYKYLFSKGFNSEVITNLLERNLQDDN